MTPPGAVVVGTGFGCRVHVPALRAAGFDVRALVGRDPAKTARRAERLGVEHACPSLEAALALPGVDAVTIATPPDTHADLAIAAVEAGRHVLCEKPFALDAVQARAMFDAATRAGVTNLVGHEFRWAPDRATVGRAIASGAIGDARLVSLVQFVPLVANADARTPPWWFDTERGGGWLGASGSHVIDQVRTWLGEFAEVSATLPTVGTRDGSAAEDSFVVRFRLRGGAEGMLLQTAASWTQANGVTVVAGTHGTVGIDGDRPWIADAGGRRDLEVPADLALPSAPDRSDDPRERFTHLELGPYTRLGEALRAGVEGRPAASAVAIPTFADGWAEMVVLDAIRASAAAGGALVHIPE
ncbi:MAG: oxidoreductase [Actinomycetia bacterium]|nr:oxidoreductase [Actinomycetes bacterium]